MIELKEKAVTTAESTTDASPFGCLLKSRHCVFKLEFVSRNDLSQSLTHLSSSDFDLSRRFDGLRIFYSPWHKHDSFRAKVRGAIHFCRVQVKVSKSLRISHKIFKVTWFHFNDRFINIIISTSWQLNHSDDTEEHYIHT